MHFCFMWQNRTIIIVSLLACGLHKSPSIDNRTIIVAIVIYCLYKRHKLGKLGVRLNGGPIPN